MCLFQKERPLCKSAGLRAVTFPTGETRTYGELAKAAGSPKAARAAGQAMRHNPIPIITPCHRVIATSGKLHGFAGKTNLKSKELKIKHYLLQLERITAMRVS